MLQRFVLVGKLSSVRWFSILVRYKIRQVLGSILSIGERRICPNQERTLDYAIEL